MNASAVTTTPTSTSREARPVAATRDPATVACKVRTAAETYSTGYRNTDTWALTGSADAAASSHSHAPVAAITATISGIASTAARRRRPREAPTGARSPAIISTAKPHQPRSAGLGEAGVSNTPYVFHAICPASQHPQAADHQVHWRRASAPSEDLAASAPAVAATAAAVQARFHIGTEDSA